MQAFIVALLITWFVWAAPEVLWALRTPSLLASRAQWWLTNPLRRALRDPRSPWPRRLFLPGLPLLLLWGALVWALFLPVRMAEALFFDLLLFPSVSLRDAALHLIRPAAPPYHEHQGRRWWRAWMLGLPRRLVQTAVHLPLIAVQAMAMAVVDLIWPSLTLYHGTRFERGATSIAQSGLWFVGLGDYAGEGVYFGLTLDTAKHYAQGSSPAILVARVTLWPCRPVATLHDDSRRKVGTPHSRQLSSDLPWPWASIEHWRVDRGWWEYCLVQPGQQGRYVTSWRIRPICVLQDGVPAAIHSGLAFWPASGDGWAVVLGSAAVLAAAIIEVGW